MHARGEPMVRIDLRGSVMSSYDRQLRPLIFASLAVAVCCCAGPIAWAQEALTLRVNDATGFPGGVVAVVLRTYASRPVGQGQVCVGLRAQRAAGGSPIEQVLGARVFSSAADAVFQAQLDGEEVVLNFSSASASINAVDGPLAVIYLKLSNNVAVGERFELRPQFGDTVLRDEAGNPIPLELRGGDLKVDFPGEPMELAAAAELTAPGTEAFLSVQTDRIRALAGGQVAFRFDPSLVAGLPQVRIDRRYGRATLSLEGSLFQEGLVMISFDSPDRSLNRLPGDIISIRFPTSANVPSGTSSAVWLDPALSFVTAANGQVLPIELEGDIWVFE